MTLSITRKSLFTAAILTAVFAVSGFAQSGNAKITRYWDACKPHCAWASNAGSNGPSGVCNKDNSAVPIGTSGSSGQTPCAAWNGSCPGPSYNGNGTHHTCWEHGPVIINANLAYGFVAVHGSTVSSQPCGTCYELSFGGSKKMIVATTNIGGDVEGGGNQFDLLVPGGGEGCFPGAFSGQLSANNINADIGIQYGGIMGAGRGASGCDALSNPVLVEGCKFLWDFGIGDNPVVPWTIVSCPQDLKDWYREPKKRPGGTPSGFTLTINLNSSVGGSVTVSPKRDSYEDNTPITVTATANTNYKFVNWTGAPSGTSATSNPITFTITANVTLTANFAWDGAGPEPVPVVDTIKVEAETSTPTLPNCTPGNDNNPMCIATEGGVTSIGYITNSSVATYTVSVPAAGSYTLAFRVAANAAQGGNVNFTVSVNGQNAGTISREGGTGGWDTYVMETLSSKANFNAGNNTVVINFGGAVNLDYFLIIGEAKISVRHNAMRTARSSVSGVTLKAGVKGFTVSLPNGHAYTSYKLIDLQGREIKRGKIGAGATDLRFSNINRGVVFLRLEGQGKATVLRATAVR